MITRLINWLLYLYAYTLVFENYDGLSLGGNSIPKAVSILLDVLILFNAKTQIKKEERKFLFPVILYFISVTIAITINDADGSDWFFRYKTIFLIIFNFLVIYFYTRKFPQVIDNMLYAFNLGVVTTTILYILGLGVGQEGGRLTIFGENANTVGLYSVISITYILNVIVPNKTLKFKPWFMLAILPLLNIIAQTGSRSTFFGMMLAVVFMFLLRSSNLKLIVRNLIIGVPVVFALINYMLSFDLLKLRLEKSVEDGDLAGRDVIWETFIPEMLDNPIWGLGVNGYTRVISGFFGQYFSPHNVFLEILAYSGLVGFVLFFLFFVRLLNAAIKLRVHRNDNFSLIVLLLILQIFASGQGLTSKVFWMFYTFIIIHFFQVYNRSKEIVRKNSDVQLVIGNEINSNQ